MAPVKFADLVDLSRFRELMAALHRATGIPHGLIDVDNNVLSGIGWQRICTDFHRVHPVAVCRCHASDHYIADHLQDGPFVGYRCANGLMDYATPIVIDGAHVATMFLGQFFHGPPDVEAFRTQAREFGFDEEAYLAALAEVPVIATDRAEATMAMFSHLAGMLADSGYDRLRLRRSEKELRRSEEELQRTNENLAGLVAERTRQLEGEVAAEHRIESELRGERDFNRAIIESLPGIFYLIGTDGRLAMWNRNFERVTGYAADELEHVPALDLFTEPDRSRIAERIAQVFADGHAVAEAMLTTRDGRAIPYAFNGLRLELGGIPYLSGLGVDVSEARHATRALEAKTIALARSNADLEQFAFVASHDLREPLRMISAYIGLLERRYAHLFDQSAAEFIAFAKDGAVRMDHLVLALLEYSRVGRAATPFAPLDSGRAARAAAADLCIAIDEAGAVVTVAEDMPTVFGDQEQLVRLFQNLIGNALKYRSPSAPPAIAIHSRREEGDWVFAVEDNGIGIAPEHRERIFLIFQRLHTRQEYDGTGIGLAIAKKIVERHGGRIWVDGNAGAGTTFRFTIPAGTTTVS